MKFATGSDILVEDVPGKGRGIVSQRRFSKGEIVLAESPLFTQTVKRGTSTVLAALASCTPEERDQFYHLHNCHGDKLSPALGIFETNVLPCGGNDAHGHVANQGGIFLLGARFNSSCVPNVNNRWDPERGQIVFRALRDISPGEELCIGYGKLLAKRSVRQDELRRKFNFECSCEACTLEGQVLIDSDTRRETLNVLYGAHMQGLCDDPMEGIGEAMLALGFLREESLPVYESSFNYSGFHFCAAVSDFRSARAWAKKAQKASAAAFGDQHASKWGQYTIDPSSYPEAGTLGKMTLAAPESSLWSYLGL